MRKTNLVMATAISSALSFATAFAPRDASAFCGFYVGGSDTKLFANATMVVLMRGGTRTVLSMQNDYQGPPENFAMVVPVPVVLKKEDVKTLPRAVFDKIDQLGSPRLVEYWEQDPCAPMVDFAMGGLGLSGIGEGGGGRGDGLGLGKLGVKVEARFDVGEYEIVILSAKDSTGLDTWLRESGYKIPTGAEKYLRPYVQDGSKFFVAKVNPAKVTFELSGGTRHAVLSPIRVHYDSDKFSLPVRLGLINSQGTQDIVVNVLARHQRYDVANYPNATIPTNLDVADPVRDKFGAFYAALFDRTIETHPRAVVTEYAWDTGTCDPCPGPTLDASDLATLGSDVLPPEKAGANDGAGGGSGVGLSGGLGTMRGFGGEFVLTRLHARYTKDALGDDLVFRAAKPIAGGREMHTGGGKLESGSTPSPFDNFQARYVIRHPWTGSLACEHPQRGIWGGPPRVDGGAVANLNAGMTPSVKAAKKIMFAPREPLLLGSLLPSGAPEIGIVGGGAPVPVPTITPTIEPEAPTPPSNDPSPATPATSAAPSPSPPASPSAKGCGSCVLGAGGGDAPATLTSIAALAMWWRRRRRR